MTPKLTDVRIELNQETASKLLDAFDRNDPKLARWLAPFNLKSVRLEPPVEKREPSEVAVRERLLSPQTHPLPHVFETSIAHLLLTSIAQRIGVNVIYLDSNGVRYLQPPEDAPLCRLVKTTEEGRRRCRACELEMFLKAAAQSDEILQQKCHAGLPALVTVTAREVAVSTGVLFLQFLDAKPDVDQWRSFLKLGRELGVAEEKVTEAVTNMPIVELQDATEVAQLVARIARELRCASVRENLVHEIGGAILNAPSLEKPLDRIATNTVEIEKTLDKIATNTVEILGEDVSVGIFVVDRLSRQLVLRAGHGTGPGNEDLSDAIGKGFSLRIGEGLVGWVAENEEARYETNVRAPIVADAYREFRRSTQSEFDVPLVYQDRLVGVINAESPRLDGFSASERNKLEVIARYAAGAIAFTENVNALFRFTEVLHRCESEEQVIKALLQAATAQSGLSFNRAAYFDVSPSGNTLTGRFAIGERNADDAASAWGRLPKEPDSTHDIYLRCKENWYETFFDETVRNVVVGLSVFQTEDFARAIATNCAVKVSGDHPSGLSVWRNTPLASKAPEYFGADECAIIPVCQDKGVAVQGIIYADNAFSSRPISDADVAILELLTKQCASLLAVLHERNIANFQLKEQHQAASMHFGHVLRTPMQMIMGACESALRVLDKQNSLESVTEQISSLHKSILEFSAILRGAQFDPDRDVPQITSCHVADVLSRVIRTYKNEAARKSVEIDVIIGEAVPEVLTDPSLLGVVLHTAIKNSVDYAKEDGGHVKVMASWEQQAKQVTIAVQDNGIGMEKSPDLDDIRPGARAPEAVELNPSGQGVGLYNAKRIVDALKVTLDVETELGSGTTFTLRLPSEPSESY